MYAGTFGNKVFKTTDGGKHWLPASAGFRDDTVLSLAVDPLNPAAIYSGTTRSSAPTGTMFAIVHFALAVDPARSGTVYAGTFEGILKTTDGGNTWNASNNGVPPSTTVFALALQ